MIMMNTEALAEDRVRENTATEVNQKFDDDLAMRIRLYAHAGPDEIDRRLRQLDQEWDMERVLQTNAATIALTGTLLGMFSKKWLLLPAFVTGFLLQHSIQGWCPPVPVFRNLGVRTRLEIEKERYALKALRGDFAIQNNGDAPDVEKLLRSLDL